MKQALFISFVFILTSFGLIFGLNRNIDISASEMEVVIMEKGEEVYSTPFLDDKTVWIFDDGNGDKILEDEEITDYFGIDYNLDYDNLSNDTWDAVYAKVDPDTEINMIIIENQKVNMYEANCPDKICVKVGSISKPNQTITCAPHELVVKLTGNGEFDA